MGIGDRLSRLFTNSPPAPALTPPAPPPAAPRIAVNYDDERVPPGAQDRVRRILACLHEIETLAARDSIPEFNPYEIAQMRDVHLPKLIKSYIDIPADHRSEIFRKTGKSASFILNESLDKMQVKIDDILRNLAQRDIDAFTDNTQFIGQRYGDEDNPFS